MKAKISMFYFYFLFMLLLIYTSDLQISMGIFLLSIAVSGFLGYEVEMYNEPEGTSWAVYDPHYEEWNTEVRQ
jgi:hypothetical protein